MISHGSHTQLLYLNLLHSIEGNASVDEEFLAAPLLSGIARHADGKVASFTGSFLLRGRQNLRFRHSLFFWPDGSSNLGMLMLQHSPKYHYSDPQVVCAFLSVVDYLVETKLVETPLEAFADQISKSSDESLRTFREERVQRFYAIRDESRAYLAAMEEAAAETGRAAVASYAKFRATLLEAK